MGQEAESCSEERNGRSAEDGQTRMNPQSKPQKKGLYLGFLTKQQLIIIGATVGLVILLIIIIVPAVVLSKGSSTSPPPLPSFSTGGDMLDFLMQSGDISRPDGLLATWFHRANKKEEMNKALASNAMILEADVTLHGYGTPGQKPVPIMAHPPDIYSDNTLEQWLDAVLASKKGIKLDFKSLESVGLSLDLLSSAQNSSRGINRPVWLNADILRGPNVPDFLPPVNGTRFLQLIQEKFPDATLSPGWKVAYGPPIFTATYTRAMVEDMYDMIKDAPQKVTFPVHALLVRSGWQHLSWLLSQSPRFSLTLWQGSINPNISDLLFVRDNTHPARVYYDIYEPTLSEFKEAARKQSHRRFYPGGDLMDFLYPTHSSDTSVRSAITQHDSLAVRWFTVTDQASLLALLSDGDGGMLVIPLASHSSHPGVPVVKGSGSSTQPLTLQDVLQLLEQNSRVPWGVYLQFHNQELLVASLTLLQSAYSSEKLYMPVWISMEGLENSDSTQDFVSTVERLFPYVTLVLPEHKWPPVIPAAVTGLSQRVALYLNAASLPHLHQDLHSLTEVMDRYDLIVKVDIKSSAFKLFKGLMAQHRGRANTNLYVISDH